MTHSIFAFFSDPNYADRALGALLDRGAKAEQLTAIFPHDHIRKHSQRTAVEQVTDGITTTTGADAISGATTGVGAGLFVGAMAAIASLSIPGFGLVTGGGALATALAALAGTAVGGGIAGGVAGYLEDQGVPTRLAQDSEAALKNGQAIVGIQVPTGDLGEFEVREILSKYGANSYWYSGDAAVPVSL